jgi:hypothetical protein
LHLPALLNLIKHLSLSMKKLYFIALLLNSPFFTYAQTLSPLITYPIGNDTFPSALVMGDMNKDGYPDITTCNQGPNMPAVLINLKNGIFRAGNLFNSNAHSVLQDVAVGDVTNDGYPETVVLDFGGTLTLVYNSSRGGFSGYPQYTVDDKAVAVKLGDVNNDGYLDAVTASIGNSTNQGTDISMVNVLLNTKQSTFGASVPYPTSTVGSPYDLDLGDVDGDGYLDIVAAFYEGVVGVLLNKKDGTFAPVVTYSAGSRSHPQKVTLHDVNKDGRLDIIATDRTRDAVEVLLQKTDGTFTAVNSYSMGDTSFPQGLAVGDVDGDGYADIVVANFRTNNIGLLRNQKDGTFASAVFYATGSDRQPTDVALSDVNKDGKLDIVETNYNGTVGIFLNTSILATQSSKVLSRVQTTIYPNPATNQASTLLATNLGVEISSLQGKLLNAVGQPVNSFTLPVKQGMARTELPTATLTPGFYFLQLTAWDKQGAAVGELLTQRVSIY